MLFNTHTFQTRLLTISGPFTVYYDGQVNRIYCSVMQFLLDSQHVHPSYGYSERDISFWKDVPTVMFVRYNPSLRYTCSVKKYKVWSILLYVWIITSPECSNRPYYHHLEIRSHLKFLSFQVLLFWILFSFVRMFSMLF